VKAIKIFQLTNENSIALLHSFFWQCALEEGVGVCGVRGHEFEISGAGVHVVQLWMFPCAFAQWMQQGKNCGSVETCVVITFRKKDENNILIEGPYLILLLFLSIALLPQRIPPLPPLDTQINEEGQNATYTKRDEVSPPPWSCISGDFLDVHTKDASDQL
jgi:hypothetical protein